MVLMVMVVVMVMVVMIQEMIAPLISGDCDGGSE